MHLVLLSRFRHLALAAAGLTLCAEHLAVSAKRLGFLVLAIFLAPLTASAAPKLARWAGHYVDENFNQVIDIDAKGRVRSTGSMFFGGDAGIPFRAEGTLRPDGPWFTLTLKPTDSLEFPEQLLKPRQLLPLMSDGRRLLMDDRALNGIINNANLGGSRRVAANFGAHELFPSEEYNRPQVQVDVDAVLPPEYRARLLSKPLYGHVTRVVAIASPNQPGAPVSYAVGPPPVSPPSRSAPEPLWHRTTLEIDLGSRDGVFPGMIVCVSDRYDEYFWVDSVWPHRSTATTTTANTFGAGDAVGSRSLRGAR
jgi:hypothetical protein